jgi:hypothetical protein
MNNKTINHKIKFDNNLINNIVNKYKLNNNNDDSYTDNLNTTEYLNYKNDELNNEFNNYYGGNNNNYLS